MRYLGRTHRISVSWLHEVYTSDDVCLDYTQATDVTADIYTKAYTNAMKWKAVCLLINLVKLDEFPELFARWCLLLSACYPTAPAGNANGDLWYNKAPVRQEGLANDPPSGRTVAGEPSRGRSRERQREHAANVLSVVLRPVRMCLRCHWR